MKKMKYITLPRQTSITQLRELCGWNREHKDEDWHLVCVCGNGDYILSKLENN